VCEGIDVRIACSIRQGNENPIYTRADNRNNEILSVQQDEVKTMLFIALVKFSKKLTKEVVEQNLKDIEDDMKGQIKYQGIYWTLGKYDTVVLFEAPDEKAAMNMVLKRADRMKIETLVAVPGDESSPAGPT
jgi:uncharacterized protein with GYD domain